MKVDKSKWEKKTLGDLCTAGSSNIVVSKTQIGVGEYPLFGASGKVGNIDFYHNTEDYLGLVKDGSGVGRIDKYPAYSSLVGTMQYLYPTELANIDYLKYLISYLNLAKYVKGAAIPHIYYRHYKNEQIRVPNLLEQQSIASELDAIQSMIDGYKAQLEDLDELAKSIFLDMFGDPVENPKGWEITNLKDVGTFARGVSKHRPRNAPELLGGTMPLIQTGDIANAGMYVLTFKDTYSDFGVAQSKVWPSGTLCITIAANIGKCSILTFDACFPDSVVGYSVNKEYILNEYVYFVFLGIQNMVESKAAGIAQKNINLQFLNTLAIPVPPLILQQQFAAKIEAIESQKEKYKAQLADAEQLMAERMQYYFS